MLPYHRKLLSAAGGGFAVQAVTFDGANDYLSVTGFSNTELSYEGIVSIWLKKNLDGVTQFLFRGVDDTFQIRLNSSNTIALNMAFGVGTLSMDSDSEYTTANGWLHLLGSWQVDSGGTLASHFYINDVEADGDNLLTGIASGGIDYNPSAFSLGADEIGSDKFDGDVAEFYINTDADSYLDLSIEANRRLFIDANGKPVNLNSNGSGPTGNQPTVYLSSRPGDAASAFATNKGDGGNFSITGTLSIAATSPSD